MEAGALRAGSWAPVDSTKSFEETFVRFRMAFLIPQHSKDTLKIIHFTENQHKIKERDPGTVLETMIFQLVFDTKKRGWER